MRRKIFEKDAAWAVERYREADSVTIAGSDDTGQPILRTVHAVVIDDALFFHGASAGEKLALIGRPVVVEAVDYVATIPSYFIDPDYACPATTYYRSAQARGTLERVDDLELKARVLSRLMTRFQPEGGYRPIRAGDPAYARVLKGLMVGRLSLREAVGRNKLGQHKRPAEITRVLAGLWLRGAVGDLRAIELIREACPAADLPVVFSPPVDGVSLHAWLPAGRLDETAALVASGYWNEGASREDLVAAHAASDAVVAACDAEGSLVGYARALSDNRRNAWIYDVMVGRAWRGRGLGRALIRLLLDHPRLRCAGRVRLGTRDADAFYGGFGFVDIRTISGRAWTPVEMIRFNRN